MVDWNERYRTGDYEVGHAAELMLKAVTLLEPGRALDLACGAGRNSLFLARNGWKVTAVDSSPEAVKIVNARATEGRQTMNVVCADLEHEEFQISDDGFELIADFLYLQRDLWPAIRNGVAPGGLYVAEIYLVGDSPGLRQMNPNFLLAPGELRSAFDDWIIEHYTEGRMHVGDHRNTARLIARRPQRIIKE